MEAAARQLRACHPGARVHVILDNAPHVNDHPRFVAPLRRLQIARVFSPAAASRLHLIEP